MDTERLRILADRIERAPSEGQGDGSQVEFHMGSWIMGMEGAGEFCATIGCIAGHAVLEFGEPGDVVAAVNEDRRGDHEGAVHRTTEAQAASLLDLDDIESSALFVPAANYSGDYDDVSGARAARACRRLAEIGKRDDVFLEGLMAALWKD